MLATSREALAIDGESVYRLSALERDDGVELFVERARSVGAAELSHDDRGIVEQIVAQLDGLPMATELAAARLVMLSPQELLERLSDRFSALRTRSRDAPVRQQTLEALLDWSYQLLSEREQRVFRRLAVFAGGWTLRAAPAVCGDETISGDDVCGAVESLLAKSLVAVDEYPGSRRFRFLDTTRDYAAALLRRSDEEERLAAAHARYFSETARDRLGVKTETPYQQWSQLQRAEVENYRTALRYALASSREYALAANILRSLGGLLLETEAFDEFCDRIRVAAGSEEVKADVQAPFWLALSELLRLKQPAESLFAAQRAVDLFTRGGDDYNAAYAIWLLAGAQLRARGALDAAIEPLLARALATARARGDRHLCVGLLRHVAFLRSENGRHAEAREALREAAETIDRTDVGVLAALIGSSAREEFRAENVVEAVRLWRQAAQLIEESRPAYASLCRINAGFGELLLGNHGSARLLLQDGLEGVHTTGHRFGVALAFDYFARLARETGDLQRSARIAGYAQLCFERGPRRESISQRLFDELVEDLRRRLGAESFDFEWGRGRFMSIDDALGEAHAA